MRPAASRLPDPVDLVVAAALTLALQAEIWFPGILGADSHLIDRPLLGVVSLGISLPLVARRTHPWSAALTALAAEVALGRTQTPPEGLGNLTAMLLVGYSLGRHAPRPTGYLGLAAVLLASAGVGEDLADSTFVAVVLGAAWAAGLVLALRADALDRLAGANEELELRRINATRAGAEDERLRIAGELHDVVAHRVSLIVVQSQAADALLDTDPEAARAAVRAVEDAARHALEELRQVLDVLAPRAEARDGVDGEVRSPSEVDLGQLGTLVDGVGAAGLPAELVVQGTPRSVPPVVSLAVFRIVQEALTNVIKHAGRPATRVRLTYAPGTVELDVENDGPVARPATPGRGLTGMAERAAFVGGSLDAAPRAEGGFRVHVLLPLPVEAR